ncbi:hypothetical protein [Neobacillus niacini]|uniref:hypothetical protein n=1 Tax=Neobacillus niacini TaxID=86668 RepID=UPI0021CB0DA4|nr:hypothetical protein [Neobacillus niacini]MCM3764255.1 hypothetical protein [Neobacillus niacini]
MKKLIAPMLAGLMLLTACQNSEPKAVDTKPKSEASQQKNQEKDPNQPFPYPNLLAEDDQTYSLLVVGIQDEGAPVEENQTITTAVKNILSLPEWDMAKKIYPNLHIKKKTAFIVFDNIGMVHESQDLQELTSYLTEHPALSQ